MAEVLKIARPRMTLHNLRVYPRIYLATPYRKFPGGLQSAAEEACKLAARLASNGLGVWSPIAHSHGIAVHGGINPIDNTFWIRLNNPWLKVADILLIGQLESWEKSDGINEEVVLFERAEKPIFMIDPNSLQIQSYEYPARN